jgi:hypothetical protein
MSLFAHLPPITPLTCESPHPSEKCPHRWRKGSVFSREGEFYRPLEDDDRARVMDRAEALERRTKHPGQRDGVLGQSALTILRAFLFHFLGRDGKLDPGYKAIKAKTGFCRQTIATALRRLERAGILEIHRRIARKAYKIWSDLKRCFVELVQIEQINNAYMANVPVPDRTEFGDLGTPPFKSKRKIFSESTSQTESTSRFLSRMGAAKRRDAFRGD